MREEGLTDMKRWRTENFLENSLSCFRCGGLYVDVGEKEKLKGT